MSTHVIEPSAAAISLLGLGGKSLGFRELQCFLSVARTGNFGRSARELNVGQPTISYQVRKLEVELGEQLLIRHGRGVALTRAGSSLCDRLDQVLQLLASPLAADAAATAQPGTVTLAVPAELGLVLIAPLIEQFRVLWPAARLDIQEGTGAELVEWVQNRRVDIAVTQDTSTITDLQIRPVLSEALGLVVSARSALADELRPMRLRDIIAHPLILPNQRHWIRRRLERAAFQAGVQLGPMVQVDSVALTKTMVRNALGCTVLPGIAVQDELMRGVLAFRPIVRPSLSVTHAIAHHRATCSATVLDLAQLLHTTMVSLANNGSWVGAELVCSGADAAFVTAPAEASTTSTEAHSA
jgi:LysR family nitrogen assimilation transcriptional regulator